MAVVAAVAHAAVTESAVKGCARRSDDGAVLSLDTKPLLPTMPLGSDASDLALNSDAAPPGADASLRLDARV